MMDGKLSELYFIKINQNFVTLKYENNIVGYTILTDKDINYPIILQKYQKEGNMLKKFIDLLNKQFSVKILNSPHHLNELV